MATDTIPVKRWIQMWVPLIDTFDLPEADPRRDEETERPKWGSMYPDIPHGIPFRVLDGMAQDAVADSPTRGKHVVDHVFCEVFVISADEVPAAVSESGVPEKTQILSRMFREVRRDYEHKADAFFDSIPDVATASDERKGLVKDVLLQAVARGLSGEKAEKIRRRLNLPFATEE